MFEVIEDASGGLNVVAAELGNGDKTRDLYRAGEAVCALVSANHAKCVVDRLSIRHMLCIFKV